MGKTLIIVAAGLTVGNVLYQLVFSHPQWGVAFDRTYFQCLALVAVYLVFKAQERLARGTRYGTPTGRYR